MAERIRCIENYVHYGSERTVDRKQLIQCEFVLAVFVAISVYFGLSHGGTTYTICTIMVVVYLISIVISVLLFLQDYSKYQTRFIFNAVAATFLLLEIMLLAMAISAFTQNILPVFIVIPAFLILELSLDVAITFSRIRRNLYAQKIANLDSASTAGALAGFFSLMIGRAFLSDISQELASLILVSGLFVLSVVFAHGVTNWLKVYYVKRYNLAEKTG